MAFPTNPVDGQQATVNGIVYTYSSALTAWTITTTTSGNVTSNNLSVTNQVSATNVIATGFISATGNITGGNLSLGGSFLTNNLISASGAVTGGSLATGGTASAGGNITGANLITGGSVIATSAVTGASVSASGAITAGGTVTGANASISGALAVGATSLSATAGEIRATNAITAFYSDARLKTEIGRIENALDKVDQLTGIIYTQNELAELFGYNNYETQVGLRAHDVKQVQPEAVKPAPFDIAEDGASKSGEYYLTVMYEKLVPLLVEAIKELRIEVKKLKGEE
jgi:hypothetical protein